MPSSQTVPLIKNVKKQIEIYRLDFKIGLGDISYLYISKSDYNI